MIDVFSESDIGSWNGFSVRLNNPILWMFPGVAEAFTEAATILSIVPIEMVAGIVMPRRKEARLTMRARETPNVSERASLIRFRTETMT